VGDCKYLYRRSKSRTDVFSQKVGGAVWTQSDHEAAVVHMLDSDPKVKNFTSQPSSFEFAGESYQPDFLVEMMDGSFEFVEVHPEQYMDKGYRKKLKSFEQYIYRRTGTSLRVVKTEDINFQLIGNLKLMKRYKVTKAQLKEMIEIIKELPLSVRFGQIEELLKQELGMGFSARILIQSGHYHFDWTKKITQNTILIRSE